MSRLTHSPSHRTSPPVHPAPQVPPEHTSVASHVMSHPPQFAGSTSVSTQPPLHSVVPPMHTMPQVPSTQMSVPVQVFPHSPQFAGSALVLTQTPSQLVDPVGHEPVPSVSSQQPVASAGSNRQIASKVHRVTYLGCMFVNLLFGFSDRHVRGASLLAFGVPGPDRASAT